MKWKMEHMMLLHEIQGLDPFLPTIPSNKSNAYSTTPNLHRRTILRKTLALE